LTPIADQPPVEAADTEDARSVSADLNRELLRKAHAQARERQQKKGYAVPAPRSSEPDPLVISNQYIPPSRDTGTPVNRGMTDSVFEFGGRKREAEFDAVPELDGDPGFPAARAKRDRTASHRPDRGADARIESPRWFDDLPDDEMPVASQSPANRDETVPEHWVEADKYERQPESRVDDSDLPVEDAYDARLDDEADEFATWAQAEASERPPEPFRLWAEIPRCCQTCRDFRPAGSGERGWCNNQWAFKHRRMVDANDRPCETSIGHWWIPGDAAWQGEFDVSALGQPTPLMDKWFGRSRGGEEPAEGPGDRRRRKTGSW
jgi:hypothetical protein